MNLLKMSLALVFAGTVFTATQASASAITFSSAGGFSAPTLTGSSQFVTGHPCANSSASTPDTVTLGAGGGAYGGANTYQLGTVSFCVSSSNAAHGDNFFSVPEQISITDGADTFTAMLNVFATLTVTHDGDYLTVTGGSADIQDTDNSTDYTFTIQPFALSACTPVALKGSGDPNTCIGYTGDDNHDPHGYMVGLNLFATISDAPIVGGDQQLANDDTSPDAPEPSTLAILGMGLAGLVAVRHTMTQRRTVSIRR